MRNTWPLVLSREVAAREASGAAIRIRSARIGLLVVDEVGYIPSSRMSRPGVSGDSRSWEDLSHGTFEQVSRRAS
jgi:hypothetical protein